MNAHACASGVLERAVPRTLNQTAVSRRYWSSTDGWHWGMGVPMAKTSTVVITLLGAGVIAGLVGGIIAGELLQLSRPGPSEYEEVAYCDAALRARFGYITYNQWPSVDRRQWPHIVLFQLYENSASCQFMPDGSMTVE